MSQIHLKDGQGGRNSLAQKFDYKRVLEKFREYCRPKKNIVYERHKFWSRSQHEGEPFDKWLKEMHVIAKD